MKFINTSDLAEPTWRFIEPFCADQDISWQFHIGRPRNKIERLLPRPNVARWRAAFTAARSARHQNGPRILVSHLPRMGAATNLFRRVYCPSIPQIAFAFNFTDLPKGFDLYRLRESLRGIDEFVVFSKFEINLYASHFRIDKRRFRYLPWAMEKPQPSATHPLPELDRYFCAIGGEARDYELLASAMKLMPEVKMVVVARPHSIEGIEFSDNVYVFTNLTSGDTWRIANDSLAMVIPLRSGETACGHITLVGAQLLGLPVIITRSLGIKDYVLNGSNALLVEPGATEELMAAIRQVNNDPELANALGQEAYRMASKKNSISAWVSYFEEISRKSRFS